ncbi:MAG: hypothetical protein JNL74_19160 [Fibrobacteres bacterium]|nr:hypothetical protein [Fibrobacterota bacterium]
MKRIISTLSIVALTAAMVGAVGTATVPEGSGTGDQTQTWEQKQDAIKTCEQSILQTKDQIKTLEQKLLTATDAEKTQLQTQLQTKEAELTQLQTRYSNMIANHQGFKYQWKDENGDGINDNVAGTADGSAKAYMYKNGYGYGYGFVDGNGDGMNDNFVDADNDGKCDTDPSMVKTRLQTRDQAKGKSQHGEHGKVQSRDGLRGDK